VRRSAFSDRADAGRRLGEHIAETWPLGDAVVVLGLPRGGVVVAEQVARVLSAPLDVIVVRKLGAPGHLELAMGAVGEDGVVVANRRVLDDAGVAGSAFDAAVAREGEEVARRGATFRAGRSRRDLTGATALIVDDGVATGSTASAACRVARALGAARVVLAAPVGPDSASRDVPEADRVILLLAPASFMSVGQFYDNFAATSDEQVVRILERAARARDDGST
jgi:putative phosphoribosyl transferase